MRLLLLLSILLFAGSAEAAKVNLPGKPRFVALVVGAQASAQRQGASVEIGARGAAPAAPGFGAIGFSGAARQTGSRAVVGFSARALRRGRDQNNGG